MSPGPRRSAFLIRIAESDEDVRRCYPILAELRPHVRPGGFLAQVRRQQHEHAYRLALLEARGRIRAVAGYRVLECLAWGRYLHVDDLVTAAADRSRGHGSRLFEWLVAEARRQRCAELHLDSGVQRFTAHRFYLQRGMHLTCHHFGLALP